MASAASGSSNSFSDLAPLDMLTRTRFVLPIRETYMRLSLIEAAAPIERRVGVAERSNDEVAGVLSEQRALQRRYEQLVSARSTIKASGNKGKLKEVQVQLEDTATQLRFATKKLVRQLQDSPHVSDDVAKTQGHVEELCRFLEKLMEELTEFGTYTQIPIALEQNSLTEDATRQTQLLEKQTSGRIAELRASIADMKEEAKRNERSQKAMIEKLREELSETRARQSLTAKFDEAEQSAALEAENRVALMKAHAENTAIDDLVHQAEKERLAHSAMAEFLERKHREMQRQTEQWDTRYEEDLENIELELENIRAEKADGIQKLTDARLEHAALKSQVEADTRMFEAQKHAQSRYEELLAATLIIQEQFRLWKKRKLARRKLTTLKREAAKAAKAAKK